MTSRGAHFRSLIEAPEILIMPGAWDGLSAILIEQAGFQGVYITGGGIARSTGVPDIGLITLNEQVARVKMICEAVSVPVLADADTGYGNAINLIRTVREMEAVGAAGIHIEDQVTPKRCGHYEGKEVVDKREFVKKIEAACAARRDPDFVIVARTDARAVLGLEEAIARGQACRAAGADVIFIEAPQTIEEIKRVADVIDAPLLINMVTKGGKTPYVPTADLERMGYDIIIFASDVQRAAIFNMRRLLSALRAQQTGEFFPDSVDFQEREGIINSDYYFQLQERYLRLD
ncbi:MAG: oxaloacetate decarboxylase [Candidatus Tectimicrobiota bacterium]